MQAILPQEANIDKYVYRYIDKHHIYFFDYLQADFEDMKRSFEISAIILLSIKDVYSIFNRWDNPKVQLNDEIH